MTIDYDNLTVITVEKDVSQTKRRTRLGDPEHHPLAAQLRAMAVDDSFFIEGGERSSCRPMITLGKRLGVHLVARDVDEDEVYQTKGVRLWRIDESQVRTRTRKVAEPAAEAPAAVEDDDDF